MYHVDDSAIPPAVVALPAVAPAISPAISPAPTLPGSGLPAVTGAPAGAGGPAGAGPPGWRRCLQLTLGLTWLLDGILQLQACMFVPGRRGLSGMLAGAAAGNPRPVASSITWFAGVVAHHAAVAGAAFALVQILIGLGIAWRPAVKPALAVSVTWSLAVWWFGEGLGGVLHGAGTPMAGGPGAVLFYALLAIVLWPTLADRSSPFAAAGAVGARAARAVWAATWTLLALLCLLGSGRAPSGVRGVIITVGSGQPGWLSAIDRHAASALGGAGLVVAVALAAACLAIAASVYFPAWATRTALAAAITVSLAIWVVTENFGTILAGGATDPNSGPLLVLLALAYWPVRPTPITATTPCAVVAAPLEMA